MFAFLGKTEQAVRLLDAATERNFCTYPSVDRDPLFDKVRDQDSFKAARQRALQCYEKFAPATKS
jgi:hypothetical protein